MAELEAGKIKSETLEEALLEVAVMLFSIQNLNPSAPTLLTVSTDINAGTVTIGATLNATITPGTTGRPVINVTEYLPTTEGFGYGTEPVEP